MSSIKRSLRDELFEKYQVCQLCGCEETKYNWFEVDHIIPKRFGGDNSPENLVLLCKSCNAKKGSLFGNSIDKKIDILTDKIVFLIRIKNMQRKLLNG